ncbi:hypothetical protein GGR57DRAFT_512373 [Xylariaceae sp. FL1272]|nr:hypothetical protein GGR57DRAFT_512373 [Xylariaceae sp. FL1272]
MNAVGVTALQEFWLSFVHRVIYDFRSFEFQNHTHNEAYSAEWGGAITTTDPTVLFNCNNEAVWTTAIWPQKDDVSGKKYGMRFKPNDDPFGEGPIDVVELNTDTFVGHQTVYADRNYDLYTLDGRVDAHCAVDRSFWTKLNCTSGEKHNYFETSSMLHWDGLPESQMHEITNGGAIDVVDISETRG